MARYEILTYTLCDGWVNIWSDDNGKPTTFRTRKQAQQELDDYLRDVNADFQLEIDRGQRDADDLYSADDYTVERVA